MARATGYVIEEEVDPFNGKVIGRYKNPIPVTIELPRGMKVIGKREDCQFYMGEHPIFIKQLKCVFGLDDHQRVSHLVNKTFCPCHNWKARKK